jgi:hypothetical protein
MGTQEVKRALAENENTINDKCERACKRTWHEMMSSRQEESDTFANRAVQILSEFFLYFWSIVLAARQPLVLLFREAQTRAT